MRISAFFLNGVLIFITACSSPKTSQILDRETGKRIDGALQSFVDSNRVAGASALIYEEVTERFWLPSKVQVGFGRGFAVRVATPQSAEENMGTVGEFYLPYSTLVLS